MLYSIMKLHVSARSGHRQVSHQLRGLVSYTHNGDDTHKNYTRHV